MLSVAKELGNSEGKELSWLSQTLNSTSFVAFATATGKQVIALALLGFNVKQ